MSDHVYKTIEITGSSPEGVTQAIDRAVAKAAESVRELDWFEVTEIRGHIDDGAVAHYQVTLRSGSGSTTDWGATPIARGRPSA